MRRGCGDGREETGQRRGGLLSWVGKQKRLDGAETMDDEYERYKKEMGG